MSQKAKKVPFKPATKKTQAQPAVLNIIKPKFNHPTMRWPSLDFVAGLFMGGTIAVVDYAKGGEMYMNWAPVEGSEDGRCEISFKLATQVVLADVEIARGLVEMYGWEFLDMVFDHDGVLVLTLRPYDPKNSSAKYNRDGLEAEYGDETAEAENNEEAEAENNEGKEADNGSDS